MQYIKKRLFEDFAAKERDGYFEIEFPIVINTSDTLVSLRIEQLEDKYIITHPEDIFSERGNDDLDFYYRIFKERNEDCYFAVEPVDGVLTMECPNDHNIAVTISDFIKFMIRFDDFIINNNVIGNEESFI